MEVRVYERKGFEFLGCFQPKWQKTPKKFGPRLPFLTLYYGLRINSSIRGKNGRFAKTLRFSLHGKSPKGKIVSWRQRSFSHLMSEFQQDQTRSVENWPKQLVFLFSVIFMFFLVLADAITFKTYKAGDLLWKFQLVIFLNSYMVGSVDCEFYTTYDSKFRTMETGSVAAVMRVSTLSIAMMP